MLTLQQVLDAVQPAAPHGLSDLKSKPSGVSTDTRTLKAGELYVALKGENFDGHEFVKQAVRDGALAVVVSEDWYGRQSHPRIPAIVVRSTLDAYGAIARAWRRMFSIPVICIAGSNGKTATKDMTADVLSQKFNVLRTPENENNQIGVPKTLLQLTKQHSAVVLEIGSNHSGEIASLCRIAEPTHGLITTIGRDHLQFLRSIEGVAGENGDLFAWLGAHNGIAFVNVDDKLIKAQAMYRGTAKVVEYGFSARSAIAKGKRLSAGPQGRPRIALSIRNKRPITVQMAALGEHNLDNALAAATVGAQFNVPGGKIAVALASYAPDPAHDYARLRVERVELDGGRGRVVTVINDTYNANPDSVYAALDALFDVKTSARHVAVLGDMLELGESSRTEHEHLGAWLLHSDIDEVYLVGEEMFHAYEAIKANRELALPRSLGGRRGKSSSPRKRMKSQDVATSHFNVGERDELVNVLFATLHNDDVILVKGSRGIHMEAVVTGLKRNAPVTTRAALTSKKRKK